MRRLILLASCCAICVAACATAPPHPPAISLAAVAGVWTVYAMPEHGDSILTTYKLWMSADTSAWKIKFDYRPDTLKVRVLAVRGDSIMMQTGPYRSALRNASVTTRSVVHVAGGKLTGRSVAHYAVSTPDSLFIVRTEGTRSVSPAAAAMPGMAMPMKPDAQFMHDMVAHHAQAIEMAGLVPTRSSSATLKLLAERITITQNDEIARMTRWLTARDNADGPEHAHEDAHAMAHSGAARQMPGMLTTEDFARLGAASGTDFDRLFLQLMIRHHQGALTMVDRLFSTLGNTQDPELSQLANNIDADQRAEIARMHALLSQLQ